MAPAIARCYRLAQGTRRDLATSAGFLPPDRGERRVGPRERAPLLVARRLLSRAPMPDSTRSLIRTLRQQLGMTQEEFAHQIAVTVSTVNRWENSHAEPSKLAWKAIRDLAAQRGLPADAGSATGTY
jgi:putative transcriptional regulator